MPSNPACHLSLSVQYGVPVPALPRWKLRRWVARTLAALPDAPAAAQLTLRLVDIDEARSLNHGFREKDYATNVLTFEYGADPEGTVSGDIVMCLDVLIREAAEQGKTLEHHAAHLTVHGTLHALGYDHIEPDEAQDMEALETAVLAQMGIADPYA
jgi:probable rRNA maturation factor